MGTVFNRAFEFVSLTYGSAKYDRNGDPVSATVATRTVKGTIQPLNGKDTVPAAVASRNTGSVKVYSTERLDFRSVDGESRGFVRCGGYLYELMDELPYQNLGPITHWKYIASLVPPQEMPAELVVTDNDPGF